MALEPEHWIEDIRENLYRENPHITRSVSHAEFVENKVVHIPQAGAKPGIEKDRSSLPASIVDRQDSELTYMLHEFTTQPILVRNLEQIQRSYNKRQSVMRAHQRALNERIGREAIQTWSVSDDSKRIVLTTGTDEDIQPPGATGTRKAVTVENLQELMMQFDDDGIPREGRYLEFPPQMYYQLLKYGEVQSAEKLGQVGALPDGVVNKIASFNILVRGDITIYNNGGPPKKKSIGAASASDDNYGAIAWHEDYVARAPGDIDVFMNERESAYYGDVMSALVMFGSTALETDDRGLGAIVQQP